MTHRWVIQSSPRSHVSLLAWLSLVVAAWLYSDLHTRTIIGTEISITAWPRALLIAIAVCAFLDWMTTRPEGPIAEATGPVRGLAAKLALRLRAHVRLIAVVGVAFGYLLALPRIGFYVATWPFMAATMTSFGIRSPKHLLITAPACLAVIVFVFTRLLFVPLPTGNWHPFYGINVWLVEFIRNLGSA